MVWRLSGLKLVDHYNRTVNYLRISVTDRCNYRCVYCMPAEGVPWKAHAEILSYEEIATVVRVGAELGITRIRITGGEPLVRRNLPALIHLIAAVPQIQDISLTTNAHLLEEQAAGLAQAGLNRINISLDTLDEACFSRMTRGGSLQKVWRGIRAAQDAGISPIKINAVIVRGVNDHELIDLARLTREHDWQVRFIELMPVENQQDWGDGFPLANDRYISVQEMRSRLSALNLTERTIVNGNGPARVYQIEGGMGTVGFISPVGEHFCETCNRLRLTAEGNLRSCLLHDFEIPLREKLKAGEDIRPLLLEAVNLKPAGHTLSEAQLHSNRRMVQIGG